MGGTDAERALTGRGLREVELVADRLRAHGEEPKVVLASPLLRAQETATILSRVLGAPMETLPELGTSGDPKETASAIAARGEQAVVLVGHEPQMGELFALLCANASYRPFRKAEARVVDSGRHVFDAEPF